MKKDRVKMLFRLFWIFFKSGTLTFSGGLGMLPIIKRDMVTKDNMIPEEDFFEYFALSQSLPGAIILNFAVFTGKRIAGFAGAFIAGLGCILPAFVAMVAVAALVTAVPKTGPIGGAFSGVHAASAAIIFSFGVKVAKDRCGSVFSIIVAAAAFILILIGLNAVWVIITAGAAGIAYTFVKSRTLGEEGKK